MKKKTQLLLKAIMVLIFGVLFIFVLIKSNIKQNKILCNHIVINILDKSDLEFIKEADVLKMINTTEIGNLINKKISEIDLVLLEKKLEENDFIDNAEIYSNFEGSIKVDVVQKKPLYRVINNNNVSYYISEKEYKIPLSSNFTAKRVITTGFIPDVEDLNTNKVTKDLKKLIDFISQNTFWEAMIVQVEVKKNGDFVLIPKLKGHTILLGDIENLKGKFSKLKTFYKKALNKTDWTKYKEINLKYEGQIICSK